MDKINWANYNYDEFELFCNALLSFEFGKVYVPFSAPGRDGGIDGSFTGSYQGHVGKWRFQFKFSLTSRNDAVSNLKSQLKEEAKRLAGEDHFVLATNVELLPAEAKALQETFDAQLLSINQTCIFWLWDGAKLFNLFIQYPILSHWLNEGFTTAQLRSYKDVYTANLDADNFQPSSMSTYFIGRQRDLEDLDNFLKSNIQMAVISGEAGIGKTRLVLEFFERSIAQLDDWIPLVLVSRNFNYDKIYRALVPGRNYLVFIDDAHTFDPKIIADMKAITGKLSNVKLILTTRNIQVSVALSLLKEYEQQELLSINLTELSRAETGEVFLRYIGNTDYRHYLNQLVTISFGKPILIVAMLNAMSKAILINDIKQQNFLKEYVTNYFAAYVDKVQSETNIDRTNVRRLLQAVALLEPFNFNDVEMVGKVSTLLGLDQNHVMSALRLLIEFGYVNGRYEQSIKPDYYSDILLSDIDANEVVRFLTDFVPIAGNVIINLSSVDELSKDDTNILNLILRIYIKLIETSQDIAVVKKILTTITTIIFVKQDISKETIDICLNCLTTEGHPIQLEYKDDKQYSHYSGTTTVGTVITMLHYLYELPANIDFVYRRSFYLYSLTEEKNAANIFAFDKKDVLKKFNMERQDFILTEITRKFRNYSALELVFALQCLKGFGALDFTLSEWSAVNRDSINITTYFLPSNVTVKNFRKRLIEVLIGLYKSQEALPLRPQILAAIIDIPRGIFATSRNSLQYNNDNEIKSILEFLKTASTTFDILEQKEILEKLYWYVQWGISQNLIPLIEEIKDGLKPKNLVERLSQIFAKAELRSLGVAGIEAHVAEKCRELVSSESKEALAEAVVSFLAQQPHPQHYYWWFQNTLDREYPDYAKALLHKLYEHSLSLYAMYAASTLGTLYYHHKDVTFYWEQVVILQNLDNIEADNVILMVYAQRVPDVTPVNGRDAETIIQIFNKARKDNNYNLAMAIQLLFAADHPDALSISHKFLERAEQRQTEIYFIRLSDNKTVSEDQMEDLIINYTIRYYLTYEIEVCLNRVLISKGVDIIFDYLVKRFDYKKQIVISTRSLSGYEFLPDGEHSRLFNGQLDKKITMFTKALQWYLTVEDDGGHLFYAKDMITYLQPAQAITPDLFSLYQTLFNVYADDGDRLERLLDTISVFHTKDDNLVQLIVDIYPTINDYQDIDIEIYKRLRYQCYNALTTMGVKSGTAGMPFQVDIDLKQLLESFIAPLSDLVPAKFFLQEVLKSVNGDIDRGRDRENLTW